MLVLLILIAVQFLVIFPQKIGKNLAKEEDLPSSQGMPEYNQFMTGVHLVESSETSRDWEMFSKEAQGHQESGRWDLGGVRIHIYNKNKIEFVVEGKKGHIAGEKQDILIEGQVQIRSENGYLLDCAKAKYISKSREIIGQGPIQVREFRKTNNKSFLLKGSGLRVSVSDSKINIEGPVLATRQLEDEKNLRIESQKAMLSSLTSEALFSEKLQILYNKFVVRGQVARLQFDEKTKVLHHLILNGGVSLKDSMKEATADSVDFDFKTKNIALSGNPYVSYGEDEIRGDKITLIDNGKRVVVDKIRAKVEKLEP